MRHGASDDAEWDDREDDGSWRVPNHARHAGGIDPATRRLALIAAGVGAVLVLGIGLWSAMGHRNTVVPVIEADSRPIRVKPENPGGLQVSGANDEIMYGDSGPATSRLAPPAEKPEPNVLRARQQEQPAPQMAVASDVPPADGTAIVGATAVSTGPASAAPAAAAHPPISGLPEKRQAAQPAAPAPATQAAGKGTLVQFAALGSEEAARAEWAHLNKRIPDLLGGRQPSFTKTERDGKTYWRVRTGGFADMAQATSFCERARAKGAACSIASF